MLTFITVIYVIVSIFLIMVVLLQSGKGAGMGAAFGGASQTMFGGRGPTTFMHKLTAASALLFMFLSVTLATLSGGSSAMEEEGQPAEEAGMAPEKPQAGATDVDESKTQEKAPEADQPGKTDSSNPENVNTQPKESQEAPAASTTTAPAQEKSPESTKSDQAAPETTQPPKKP